MSRNHGVLTRELLSETSCFSYKANLFDSLRDGRWSRICWFYYCDDALGNTIRLYDTEHFGYESNRLAYLELEGNGQWLGSAQSYPDRVLIRGENIELAGKPLKRELKDCFAECHPANPAPLVACTGTVDLEGMCENFFAKRLAYFQLQGRNSMPGDPLRVVCRDRCTRNPCSSTGGVSPSTSVKPIQPRQAGASPTSPSRCGPDLPINIAKGMICTLRDNSPWPCPYCTKGRIACDECGGDSFDKQLIIEVCARCGGSGWFDQEQDQGCWKCGGDRGYPGRGKCGTYCTRCKGTGKVECSDCQGTHTIPLYRALACSAPPELISLISSIMYSCLDYPEYASRGRALQNLLQRTYDYAKQ